MDIYSLSAPDFFGIDDLLDFSNDAIFTSSSGSASSSSTDNNNPQLPPLPPHYPSTYPSDFTDDLCVPNDDVAELEWLSQFVDDSFADFPASSINGTLTVRPDNTFSGRARSKRSRAIPTAWTSSPEPETLPVGKSKSKDGNISSSPSVEDGRERRCTHCASEKTPQWRTGPLGPKTLCNACGVRYKSGRLVPEYRPAASPTFMLTQHSNSHRKVMELRRQKEMTRQHQEDVHRHY